MSSRLLVLCYHNVNSTWCFPAGPGDGVRGLESQLRMLNRLFHVIPLEDAAARLAEGRTLPRRAAAITYDDGYRDNLALAVPMLERLGLPATFFLVPGLLSNDSIPWWSASVAYGNEGAKGHPARSLRGGAGSGEAGCAAGYRGDGPDVSVGVDEAVAAPAEGDQVDQLPWPMLQSCHWVVRTRRGCLSTVSTANATSSGRR